MIIQYCQKCGVRVSEQDLQSGKAVAQGEHLFCERCRGAAAPLPQPQPTSVVAAQKSTARKAPIPAPAGRTTGRPEAAPSASPQPLMLYGGIGVAVVLLALIYFLTSGSSGNPKTASTKPAATSREDTAKTSANPSPPTSSITPSPAVTPPTGGAKTEKDPEAEASDEFDKLRRFEGLGANDKAGRIERIEVYLKKYGEAIIAGRARAMLNELKNPPSAKTVAEAQPPAPAADPAQAKPVPADAAAELPSFVKIDFEGAEAPGWNAVFAEPVADPTERAKGRVLKLKTLAGDYRARYLAGDFPGQTPQLNHGAVMQVKPGGHMRFKYYTTGVNMIDLQFHVVGMDSNYTYKIREPKLKAWTDVDVAFGDFSYIKGSEVVSMKAPESGLISDANIWGYGPTEGSVFYIDDFEIGVPAADKAKP